VQKLQQLAQLLGEGLRGPLLLGPHGGHRALVAPERPAETKIDPPREERLQRGELLSSTPPEPSRIRSVAAASRAITTAGADVPTPRML
jgi:hypothetical protein